jgi:sphingolipid delta-4 desaturase
MTTPAVAWHTQRHAQLLRRYPQLRDLNGPDPWSGGLILGLACIQLGLAATLRSASYLTLVLCAYLVGAFFSHALGVLIHEATHNLVAKRTPANKVWGLVANLPLVAPAAMEFRYQHMLHHRFLGDADGKDTQAPTRHEARVVGASPVTKLLSFTLGRFVYQSRPANAVPFDRWMALNWGAQIAAMGALWAACGVKPLVYLLVSALAAFGPHPVGARRLSEHLPALREQPTNSYYGPLNLVSFNVGYHVEHHDFPAVAWRHLPRVTEIAKDDYGRLFAVRSWTLLLADYLWSPRMRVDHYVGMGPSLEEERKEPRFQKARRLPVRWWEYARPGRDD